MIHNPAGLRQDATMSEAAQRVQVRVIRRKPPAVATGPACRVLLAYENFAAGLRGRQMCEWIAEKMAGEAALTVAMWRTDLFEFPALARTAARQAAHADIVIVAAHTRAALVPGLATWLAEWAGARQAGPGALVAVFGPVAGAAQPDESGAAQLQQAATRTRREFFCAGAPEWREPSPPVRHMLSAFGRELAALIDAPNRANVKPALQADHP
ncbi:MAG TPA: hypothetical protein VFV96_16815 [Verrucomicrobiae bacterium]|nr:hypothetical protein [Verrucomicrobiae bacterium]